MDVFLNGSHLGHSVVLWKLRIKGIYDRVIMYDYITVFAIGLCM